MSCSSIPPAGAIINWTDAPSHANTVIDVQTNSVNMNGTWYHNLICANSFRFFVQPRYDLWGSDHIRVKLWKFNLNTSKWEALKEVNYLNGKNNHSLWINVNSQSVSSGSHSTWTLTIPDAIHFDVEVYRIAWGAGNAKTTHVRQYMGAYFTTPENFYNENMKGKTLQLKKQPGVVYSWWDASTSRPSNPFDTEWGNITSARGSLLLESEPYRLIVNYKES